MYGDKEYKIGDCFMTREELLELIKSEIEIHKDYPNIAIMDALEAFEDDEHFEENFDLVAPILEIIGTHPEVDFGNPGDLVHFMERYCGKGYEEILIESVRKNPTYHNIFMLHRCYNDATAIHQNKYRKLIEDL